MPVELRESTSFEKENQSTSPEGNLVVGGRFSRADVENENGRIYKTSMWKDVLGRPQIQEAIKERRMVGELGHPDKIETTPINISHIVTKLELEPDGEVYGEAEILPTPSGQILRILYENGVKMGISSRGYLPEGSNLYQEGDAMVVPDDYELITFDFVIDPSSQGACPTIKESSKKEITKILTESKHRINSDIADYVEKNVLLSENKSTKGKVLTENKNEETLLRKSNRKAFYKDATKEINKTKKGVNESMEKNKYDIRVQSIVKDLKNRYLTAESVIEELTKERNAANEIIEGVTKRYLTAEEAVKGLRDYSLRLEEATSRIVDIQNESVNVISVLRDRFNLSESVIKELRDRYTLSESVIGELVDSYKLAEDVVNNIKDRYTLSEQVIGNLRDRCLAMEEVIDDLTERNTISEEVIKGLRDRLASARKANLSLKAKGKTSVDESSSKEIAQLKKKIAVQEEVINELVKESKKSNETETPVTESKSSIKSAKKLDESKAEQSLTEVKTSKKIPNSYFVEASRKYGISVEEAKKMFKNLGCKKSAFEYHLNEMKRYHQNRYSEYPYFVEGASASKQAVKESVQKEDVLANIVAAGF